MITKMLEIRDEGTCIPVIAIRMVGGSAVEDRFLRRCGYPQDGHGVVLMTLSDQRTNSEAYGWSGCRTMTAAHNFIIDNFDTLYEGQVVDVRVILGEETEAAEPEIWIKP